MSKKAQGWCCWELWAYTVMGRFCRGGCRQDLTGKNAMRVGGGYLVCPSCYQEYGGKSEFDSKAQWVSDTEVVEVEGWS